MNLRTCGSLRRGIIFPPSYVYRSVRAPFFCTFWSRSHASSVFIYNCLIYQIMKPLKIAACAAVALCCYSASQGQLLKKLKEKAQQVGNKIADKKVDDATGVNNGNNGDNSGNGANSNAPKYGKPSNKG